MLRITSLMLTSVAHAWRLLRARAGLVRETPRQEAPTVC